MIYLLDGKETYFLAKKKHSLIEEARVEEENIITIDGSNATHFSMRDVLQYCDTISLFGEGRIVIVDNPFFLNSSGPKRGSKKGSEKDSIADLLDQYCSHPSDTTDLILYCYGYDADKRTKEFQILNQYVNKTLTHLHFGELSPQELNNTIQKELSQHGLNLTKDALDELKLRIGTRTSDLYKALEKLILFDKKELNLEDIQHLVSANTEVDIWKFGNAFLKGQYEQAIRAYHDLFDIERLTPSGIIPILSSQIRGVYNSVKCNELGMAEAAIKKQTGRMYPNLDIQSAGSHNSDDLLQILADLADMDQGIKSGRYNDTEIFETFMLRYL